jgi:hypothetical protein
MYVRSDYYENSNETDKLMADIYPKPSILLTPTAYDNGSLHSVKPVQSLGSENIINGNFSNGENNWTFGTGWSVIDGKATVENQTGWLTTNGTPIPSNKQIKLQFDLVLTGGTLRVKNNTNDFSELFSTVGSYTITRYYSTGGSTSNLQFPNYGSGFSGSIDNVSVKEVIDADFDFTRGSSATRVNEKGLIEDVQILSGNLVQNGDFSQIGSELVINGDFDTDSNWTKQTNVTLTVNDGIANVFSTQAFVGIYQLASITAGKIYKATIRYKSDEDIRIYVGGSSFSLLSASSNFTTETAYITAAGISAIYVLPTQANQTIEIDNVSVKEVGQNWIILSPWIVGDNVLSIDGSQVGNQYASQIIPSLTSGNKYKLQYTVSNITAGQFRINVANTLGTYVSSNGTYEFVFNASSGTSLQLQASTTLSASVSNISLIEITEDTDLPRINYTNFDYENGEVVPYSGTGSLLLEKQSTNLITYSEDFNQSSWTKLGSGTASTPIVTSNYATSPNGLKNASRLQCDLNGGTTISDQSIIYDTISGSGDTSAFVYVKSNTSYNQTFYLANSFNDRISAVATTKWQKLELNWNAFGNGRTLSIGARGGSGSDDTLDLLIWGAQVEALPYATSYIPNLNGEVNGVTRLADVCNNAASSDLINSESGVLYAEISALSNVATRRGITISNGTTSNRVMLRYDNASNRVQGFIQVGGSTNGNINSTAYTITNFLKIAYKWKAGDFALWINGTEVDTSTDATSFSADTLSEVNFDRGENNAEFFYGNVKCVAVFKEALDNDQLERLTGEGYESFNLLAQANNYTII